MQTQRFEFPKSVKEAAWDRAMGRCEVCTAPFNGRRCIYDHIIPAGLRTGEESATLANCRVLCPKCNEEKTAMDMQHITKAKRIYEVAANLRAPKKKIPSRPFTVTRINHRRPDK